MLGYVWLIPLFPRAGTLVNGLLGRRLSRITVSSIACLSIGLSFLTSLLIFLDLLRFPPGERVFEQILFTWISSGAFQAEVGLLLDPLSTVMILVVSGVGFLIHVYSVGYMAEDRDFSRYFAYLNLCAASMLILVLANSALLFFLGWEAVGLCSYLLIGFWFERKAAASAATKAFIVNRVGDFGFAIGILLLFATFGTLDLLAIFKMAPEQLERGGVLASAITLLLFMGATGKSAQIPLYVWLPDAMEGPTPVSALIHAATMVTAGVYMVARFHVLYEMAPFSMAVVAVVGALTALFAASIALVQNDIKRVMAYSTISQLGYMFLGAGIGAFAASIFHLMTHAFFKALLFLGAGSLMHALDGETDIRKMGGLKAKMPITCWTFLIGAAALAGFPGLSGFFSKDEILFETFSKGHRILWLLGLTAVLLTAFYSFRVFFLAFFSISRVEPAKAPHIHESPPVMAIPLILLACLSVVGGYVGLPPWSVFTPFLEPVFGKAHGPEAPASQLTLMALATLAAFAGIGIAYLFYLFRPELPRRLSERFQGAYTVLLNKYYVDELYEAFVVKPLVSGSLLLWKTFDVKVVDGLVNGVALFAGRGSAVLRRLQTGYVPNYVLLILVGVVAIVGYLTFGH
jgi:NADH-quinone oxidoreductase subunit L